jgi:hypothetical protein
MLSGRIATTRVHPAAGRSSSQPASAPALALLAPLPLAAGLHPFPWVG